ncbi:hypothetical protein [Kingella potus]|uniref:hypothetical protein n=1 Tax=Kingella potus TaxID=265175 RepID=UPI001FD35891|nr:hypothetical protein [Kingella potus]UOP00774.1 hypothetical protein LVJ84_13610 [Kingella potus]
MAIKKHTPLSVQVGCVAQPRTRSQPQKKNRLKNANGMPDEPNPYFQTASAVCPCLKPFQTASYSRA